MAETKEQMFEDIFKAIGTIASANENKYNRTITAVIENNINKDKGEYTCSDGSSNFTAYSENTTYKKGTSVYVVLPNGDWTADKLITGKCVSTNSETITYISPLDSFIDITGNLVQDNSNNYGIATNGIKSSIIVLEDVDAGIFQGYTRMGLSARFSANLNSYGLIKGNYGLGIVLKNSDGEEIQAYKLDSSEMTGSPYNFSSFVRQEKCFDVSNVHSFSTLDIYLYQDNNFTIVNDASEEVSLFNDIDKSNIADNIYVKDIELNFGYDISETDFQSGDLLKLYCIEGTTFKKDTNENKTIKLRWIHQLSNGTTVILDEEEDFSLYFSDYKYIIHWYRYNLSDGIEDDIAGAYWEEITDNKNLWSLDNFCPVRSKREEMLKVIIEVLNLNYDIEFNNFEEAQQTLIDQKTLLTNEIEALASSNLTISEKSQKISEYNAAYQEAISGLTFDKGLIYYDSTNQKIYYYEDDSWVSSAAGIQYATENLDFLNEKADEMIDDTTLELIRGLTLECDTDGYNGVYNIYRANGEIMSDGEARKARTIVAKYGSLATGLSSIDKDTNLEWWVPIDNTMISLSTETLAAASKDDSGKYYIITNSIAYDSSTEVGQEDEQESSLVFYIKDFYSECLNNNTIECHVNRGSGIVAKKELMFGSSGTNGIDYTLTLNVINSDVNYFDVNLNTIEVEAKLYDYNRNDITSTIDTFYWEWENQNSSFLVLSSEGNICTITADSDYKLSDLFCYILKCSCTIPIEADQIIKNYDLYGTENLDDEDGDRAIAGAVDITDYVSSRNVYVSQYLPIPIKNISGVVNFYGATKITYNSQGVNPEFYNGEYAISVDGTYLTDVSYEIYIKDSNTSLYYPKVQDKKLLCANMYVENLDPFCVNVIQNDIIIYSQPIYMSMDRWTNAALNSWDGNLTIDEKNGIILSTMIGAGKKNTDNSFSGVLMGDISGQDLDNNSTYYQGLGLYGFSQGERSFGFNVNGTAFLGKSGSGQIRFNGNKGVITSAGYEENDRGIKIDLDDAWFEAKYKNDNEKITAIKISAPDSESSDPYFQIKAEDKILLKISKNAYYFQTANFFDTGNDNITEIKDYISSSSLSENETNLGKYYLNNNKIWLVIENKNTLSGYDSQWITEGLFAVKNTINMVEEESAEEIVQLTGFYQATEDGYSEKTSQMITLESNNIDYKEPKNYHYCYVISDSLYYQQIQSKDPFILVDNDNIKKGLRFDLSNSKLIAYDFNMVAYKDNSNNDSDKIVINSGADDWPFKIGDNFRVSWDGSIKATAGKVGGWTIENEYFKSGSTYLFSSLTNSNQAYITVNNQQTTEKMAIRVGTINKKTTGVIATDVTSSNYSQFYTTADCTTHASSYSDDATYYRAQDTFNANSGDGFAVTTTGKVYVNSGQINNVNANNLSIDGSKVSWLKLNIPKSGGTYYYAYIKDYSTDDSNYYLLTEAGIGQIEKVFKKLSAGWGTSYYTTSSALTYLELGYTLESTGTNGADYTWVIGY